MWVVLFYWQFSPLLEQVSALWVELSHVASPVLTTCFVVKQTSYEPSENGLVILLTV